MNQTRSIPRFTPGLAALLVAMLLGSPSATLLAQKAPAWQTGFLISSFSFPLVDESGDLVLRKVPARIEEGDFPANLVSALSSPVYVTSDLPTKRGTDLNAITQTGLHLSITPRKGEDSHHERLVVIDLSKVRPFSERVSVADVVSATITCLRLPITPGYPETIRIKIEGTKDPATWKRFEGPLYGGGTK